MDSKKLLAIITVFLFAANIFVFLNSENIKKNYEQKLILKFNKSTEKFIEQQKQANNKLLLEDLKIVSRVKPRTLEESIALNLAVFYVSTASVISENGLKSDLNNVTESPGKKNIVNIESIKDTGLLAGIDLSNEKIALNLKKYLETIVEHNSKKLKEGSLSLKEKQIISKKIILLKTLLSGPEYLNALIEKQLK